MPEAVRHKDEVKGVNANKVLTWATLAVLAYGLITVAVHVQDSMAETPKIKRAVRSLERRADIYDWYLPAIGKRLGIPPPPLAMKHQDADQDGD